MNTNWTKIAPIAFMYEPNDTISNRLREFYLGSIDKPITNDSYDGLGKVRADWIHSKTDYPSLIPFNILFLAVL